MSIDAAAVEDYSDANILKILKAALANSATAKGYTIGGRAVTSHSLTELQELIEKYERRVATAGGTTGTVTVGRNLLGRVSFGPRGPYV